ncbi:uncharacterized protein EV420DRAFT_1146527 [Desarmillaria tabescens]|uniref:Uncharacterized protein n=1 Tax=Armillaria tabescens TaxID=1929756 RepID=A0AA39NCG4_ARMTA|nr:uncharacterized protein EV420DRAFT_1146527 [Desarmillaria tabescens]KAK0462953.1 hypothetical protein EV420DRAFT_1146527 [Desarmillaria tabescens]
MAQWLGPSERISHTIQSILQHFPRKPAIIESKATAVSSFADLRLCVVTKPRIPSMTLMFGKDYVKEYREFSRYIDTIPSDQKPSLHIKLYIREINYTPINVKVFNTFCTRLVDYGAVTSISSFREALDPCKDLDVKRPGQPVFHSPPFTTLTELHLDFVSNRFADWLLRSAAASPIRELSISHGFPGGRIHIPTLRKLELREGSTTTSRMIQLLSDKAHSSLSELVVTGEPYWEMPVKGRMIPLRANAMPSLTSLASDFKVLINLLVTPEAFPKLEQVKVYHMGGKDSSVAKDAEELLARISPLPSVHCITFPVSALEPTDWDNLSGCRNYLAKCDKVGRCSEFLVSPSDTISS